jgi:hypothetical protein
MVWRYRVEVRSADELPEDTRVFLDEQGSLGWELVSTVMAGGFNFRRERPAGYQGVWESDEGSSLALRFYFKKIAYPS